MQPGLYSPGNTQTFNGVQSACRYEISCKKKSFKIRHTGTDTTEGCVKYDKHVIHLLFKEWYPACLWWPVIKSEQKPLFCFWPTAHLPSIPAPSVSFQPNELVDISRVSLFWQDAEEPIYEANSGLSWHTFISIRVIRMLQRCQLFLLLGGGTRKWQNVLWLKITCVLVFK